ncbi:MAG: D-alanyl-D-alanine carboxypeptidase family protein [Verrucomicrobiota bacterium]
MKRRTLLSHAALALPGLAFAADPRSIITPGDVQVPSGNSTDLKILKLPPVPTVTAKACMVLDAVTGTVFYEKNADERRAVASTQKLLSAIVCTESTPLDRIATVTPFDTSVEPHKMPLIVGEQYPLRTLLQVMLIESCNDAARCLARTCAGSEDRFAEWMTKRAIQLGMKNSQFKNASGLPAEGQYSTARDMSRAARAALYNPTIRGIVGQGALTISRPDGRVKNLRSTNHLLRRNTSEFVPICTGMKTGFTNAAGKCLICSGNYRGRSVICILLGSSSRVIWKESRNLLNWSLGLTTA